MLKYHNHEKNRCFAVLIIGMLYSCTIQNRGAEKKTINSLQGVWFEINEENASFKIDETKIIYTENQSMIAKIRVSNDSLILNFDSTIIYEKIDKLNMDTLILTNDGITTTYIRKK